jgi:hypothetical protein
MMGNETRVFAEQNGALDLPLRALEAPEMGAQSDRPELCPWHFPKKPHLRIFCEQTAQL